MSFRWLHRSVGILTMMTVLGCNLYAGLDTDLPPIELTITWVDTPSELSSETRATIAFICNQEDPSTCTYECGLDEAPLSSCTSPHELQNLSEGAHIFRARALVAGYPPGEIATYTWTIDTSRPEVVFTQTPAPQSSATTARFAFDCNKSDCTFFCALDGENPRRCTSPREITNLAPGAHAFALYATDMGGNQSATITHTWSVLGPPEVIFTAAPDARTRHTSASIEFTCTTPPCTYECTLNGEAISPCTSPVELDDLPDGDYVFEIWTRADGEDNGPTLTHQWSVDTLAPIIILDNSPTQPSFMASAVFEFFCDKGECTYTCALGETPAEPCTSPRVVEELPLGEYTFTIVATDDLGNISEPLVFQWTIEPIRWQQISAGFDTTCGQTAGGATWCWGANARGQLGDGTPDPALLPLAWHASNEWVLPTIGQIHICAIRSDSLGHCIGGNTEAQLGNGSTVDQDVPVRLSVLGSVQTLAAAQHHGCAISNGELHCWGRNSLGQVGDNTNAGVRHSPRRVGTANNWQNLDAGSSHTCAIEASGALVCWGSNQFGQLGTGSTATSANSPDPVHNGAAQVSAGADHTCSVALDGTLRCWGSNAYGQLAREGVTTSNTPLQVGADEDWLLAAAGDGHTCALKSDSSLWCWGRNDHGQLGQGDRESSLTPLPVPGNWTALAVGHHHSCALDTDEALWCWGRNDLGQLGNATHGEQLLPGLTATPSF